MVVPDLLGLDVADAADVAAQVGLRAVGPEGTPQSLLDMSGPVVLQRPEPGVVARTPGDVMVWTSGPGGDAGVREPRHPVPPALGGEAAESPAL